MPIGAVLGMGEVSGGKKAPKCRQRCWQKPCCAAPWDPAVPVPRLPVSVEVPKPPRLSSSPEPVGVRAEVAAVTQQHRC